MLSGKEERSRRRGDDTRKVFVRVSPLALALIIISMGPLVDSFYYPPTPIGNNQVFGISLFSLRRGCGQIDRQDLPHPLGRFCRDISGH